MVITFHRNFVKRSKSLTKKEKEKLTQRLKLFEQDQFNPVLNNHSLSGKYLGTRSINIAGDLRALYREKGDLIIFVNIDNHSNLYG